MDVSSCNQNQLCVSLDLNNRNYSLSHNFVLFSGEGLLDCFRTVETPIISSSDTARVGTDELEEEGISAGVGKTEEHPPQKIIRIPSYKLSPTKHAHVTAVER